MKERSCLCLIICLLCIRADFILKHPFILRRLSRNKSVLMMQAVVCFSQATAVGSFNAYSRSNSRRIAAVSHCSCSTLVHVAVPLALPTSSSNTLRSSHYVNTRSDFSLLMASLLNLCLTLLHMYITPSKCSATISSHQLAQDTEMILRAVRILVTVISVTYWQQCLSGYTYDHPQFPFTEPDSSSGHTNQVSFLHDSDTLTSISHLPF